ncbi:hypothetical protein ACFQH2_13210 [Natronoarchaeum sp. GCM10025703]
MGFGPRLSVATTPTLLTSNSTPSMAKGTRARSSTRIEWVGFDLMLPTS